MARALIVLADDFIGDAVSAVLEAKGHTVRVQVDEAGLDHALEVFRPDLAMIQMRADEPDLRALSVGRRFRSASDAALLYLMGSDRLEDRIAAFEIGADDVLSMPFAMAELCARAQALLRRSGTSDAKVHCIEDVLVDELAHTVSRRDMLIDLTSNEFSLLMAMLRHRGQVLSKVQLLDEVWGFEHYDVNVVEVHISALRRKLEAHGPRLIHTVRGVGYVLRSVGRPALASVG
jgi:DNA-binding response OmpR family regulator